MRIEWIEVENFKGFDKRRFEFDEHFTLIVGENGMGKTSLALAVAETMRQCVTGVTWKAQRPSSGLIRVLSKRFGKGLVSEKILPLRLMASLKESGERLDVNCEAVTEEALLDYGSKGTKRALSNIRRRMTETDNAVWPMFAFYGADRNSASTPTVNVERAMTDVPSRDSGYDDWSRAGYSTKDLAEWMWRQVAISLQEFTESPILDAVKSAISKCLPECSHVWFSIKQGCPVVEWESGLVTSFTELSDGQKAILSLIGDVARRCTLLNPHLEGRSALDTPGIVVIDEIDLHLHPRWQRRIMEDLRRVFPKIQFIATTHSPIIISAAKDAKIIHLDADGSHEISQAYGMDVNWVVDVVQGAESQAHEVTELIRKIEGLIEDARLDEARNLIPELERLQNGPSPDSVRLNAEMDNLIALANAED